MSKKNSIIARIFFGVLFLIYPVCDMWDYGCDRKLVKGSATHAGQCRIFRTFCRAFGGPQFRPFWIDRSEKRPNLSSDSLGISSSFFPEGFFLVDEFKILALVKPYQRCIDSSIAPHRPAGGRRRLLQVPGPRFGLPGGCLPTWEAINHIPLSNWYPRKLAPRELAIIRTRQFSLMLSLHPYL